MLSKRRLLRSAGSLSALIVVAPAAALAEGRRDGKVKAGDKAGAAPAQSGEQDLPMPDPTLATQSPNYMQTIDNMKPDGSRDMSDGDGQMLTRSRRF